MSRCSRLVPGGPAPHARSTRISTPSALVFSLIVLPLLTTLVAAQPTLTTDAIDYSPGATATISGSGFAPGESIDMSMSYGDGSTITTGLGPNAWSVTADASGAFTTTWLVCDCPNLLLLATAIGESGNRAGIQFWDSGLCTPESIRASNGWDETPADSEVTTSLSCNGIITAIAIKVGGGGQNFVGFGTNLPAGDPDAPTCPPGESSHSQVLTADWTTGDPDPNNIYNGYVVQGIGTSTVTVTDPIGGQGRGLSHIDTICTPCVPCTLTCPPDVTIDCGDSTDPSNTGAPTGCESPPFIMSETTVPGICPTVSVITREWAAFSGCDDIYVSCVQTITVVDNTPPMVFVPGNVDLDCTATDFSPAATGSATATDACDDSVTITSSDVTIPGSCPANFVIERTWTATDDCNNSSSATQYITVSDTTPPTLTVPADTSIDCSESSAPGNTGMATATDDCDPSVDVTFTDTGDAGDCGTFTRTWTATDDCGNSVSGTQTITVVDNTPPTLTVPADVSIDCAADSSQTSTGTATATDNCDDAVAISYTDTPGAGDCYSFTRTWTATDDCGNSTSGTQTITVTDITPPVLTVPADATVDCAADPGPANAGSATATDNCDTSVSVTYTDGGPMDACGSFIRTWTATDDCGNSASDTQTVTVVDTTPPTIAVPADITLECGSDAAPAITGFATATDDCDTDVEIAYSDSITVVAGQCGNETTILRTWTATDCANTASAVQTITYEDTTPPEIVLPSPLPGSVSCAVAGLPDVAGLPTGTDTCSTGVDLQYADSIIPGDCPGNYTVSRLWTATDDCGNLSTATQTFEVSDTLPPVILTCPGDTTVSCDADSSPGATGLPTVDDDCDDAPTVTWTDVTAPGACANESTITRTFTATDHCGNASTCVQTITVIDETAPVITCPPAITIECDASTMPANTGSASATDNCDTDVDISYSDVAALGGCNGTGTITRTWVATDDCGNTDVCVQVITVEDSTAPEISCPAAVTVQCDASTMPANTGSASATDNCDPAAAISYTDVATLDGCNGTGSITRTWTATDACGNSSECVQVITVVDTTPPVIACPSDATVQCDASAAPSALGSATATDNCSDPVAITFSDVEVLDGCNGTGTITRTWTATDDCGNSAQCVQTITVIDTTPPAIDCPASVTLECPADTSVLALGSATATDNCDLDVAISFADTTVGGCGNTQVITRTWTATDACNNTSTCVQTITVEDTLPPAITCPPSVTVQCTDDTSIAALGAATAIDGCGTATVDVDESFTPACGSTGTITRLWTATDECGNSISCTQTITIVDNTPPTITCPADTTVECTGDTTSDTQGMATGSDACGTVTISSSDSFAAGCGGTGVITRTWTATDECGNQASCEQTITIVDTTPPTISCPADTTVECTEDTSPTTQGMASGSDTCGAVTISSSDSFAASCGDTGVITRTWTATDECGNQASCEQTITIVDTTPPTISCPTNTIVECTGDTSPTTQGMATGSDTCGAVTISSSDSFAASCGGTGVITRTWTATDACGNETSCDQTITIVDTTPPTISCPTNTVVECTGDTTPATQGMASGDDTCGGVAISFADTFTDACGNTGTIARVWTATDDCGNQTSCTQTITIVDTTDPTITCPPTATVQCGDDTSPAATGSATGSDTCGTVTIEHSDAFAEGCGATGVITRTWTVSDECGNSVSCDQVITIVDTTPPTIVSCPADVSVECNTPTDPSVTGMLTATDSCGTVTIDYTDDVDLSGCNGTGTITRSWTAVDECGNSIPLDACVQTISVVDTTPPVITYCPPDVTIDCDDYDPSLFTGMPTAEDNCTGMPVITYSDDTTGLIGYDGSGTIIRTWTATDDCGNDTMCVQQIVVVPCNVVTNTERCIFDWECDGDPNTRDFRLNFTQDPQNWPCFRANATNPGQYFFNVVQTGVPGSTVTFDLTVPYPFVTQGAQPVHGYGSVGVYGNEIGETCFDPTDEFYVNSTQVTLSDYTDTNGDGMVGYGDTYTFAETVTFSGTGFVFLAVHMDYGLKGEGGYTNNSNDDAVDGGCSGPAVATIPNYSEHLFSYVASTGEAGGDSVTNCNSFKRNPGVGGMCLDLFGDPVEGCQVRVWSLDNGAFVGNPITGVSDMDGFYSIRYKHTGPRRKYTVMMWLPGNDPTFDAPDFEETIIMRPNRFYLVDFLGL